MPTLLTRIETDLESIFAHIKAVLEKHPDAHIVINQPTPVAPPVLTIHPFVGGSPSYGPTEGK